MSADARKTCPSDCTGCPAKGESQRNLAARPADCPADAAGATDLSGGRLVLAAAYVFLLPLLVLLAGQLLLAGRIGELPALAVGLAGAVVLSIPAWRMLRRRKGQEVNA